MHFFTIGVYNSSEQEFFNKLTENEIDTFCDIRRRRGVRGSQYAFVNSNRLQNKLSALNIRYKHILDLAPTEEIRQIQAVVDKKEDLAFRKRQLLDNDFALAYKEKILKGFNFDSFISELKNEAAEKVVLFCVEENPEACHRSIVSEELQNRYKFIVTHL